MDFFDIHEEVYQAIRDNAPVTVIESTIWIHGLPPEMAMEALEECCEIVREEGAVPAVTAISSGKILVGLSKRELAHMFQHNESVKVNLRDIASCLKRGLDGSTTVSTTLFIANRLGLPVAVTGGIGGVHRGAEKTFDISADLHALARYPVTLVSSGIKSILNVGATLEVLETLGVPVIGYRTSTFPLFYTRESSFPVPERIDTLEDVSLLLETRNALKMEQGLLLVNPIPSESQIPLDEMEELTEKILASADEKGISGKEVTPFVLSRLHEMSGGRTVEANLALIKENCRLGAGLSRKLSMQAGKPTEEDYCAEHFARYQSHGTYEKRNNRLAEQEEFYS